MPKLIKYFALPVLLVFALSCNALTRSINKAAGGLAETAQAVVTAMPMQTLQALATQVSTEIPSGTLEALPSALPSLEALGTNMPDIQGMFDPQGTPLTDWKGIPVMPQATAGQEDTNGSTYSYRADASVKEAQDYYKTELEKLGWTSYMNMPGDANGSIQIYQKDNNILTVTIIESEGKILVILAMG
jgi:hypothetical protein